MTGVMFSDWLRNFDRDMRNVLLFLDNAPSHKHDLKLTNTKLVFFPAKTTSKLQPMDQGIIQNFKSHYRNRMLEAAVSNIDNNDSSTDIAKSITVHDAVTRTAYAARKVTNQTVTNCFYHAGFPRPADTDTDLPATTSDQAATDLQLASLVARASSYVKLKDPHSAADYLASDELAPTTEELAEDWEDHLLQNYTTSASTDNKVKKTNQNLNLKQNLNHS